MQYSVSMLSPQHEQAPLSKLQAALLFLSSQNASVAQSGALHPIGDDGGEDVDVVVIGTFVVVGGDYGSSLD